MLLGDHAYTSEELLVLRGRLDESHALFLVSARRRLDYLHALFFKFLGLDILNLIEIGSMTLPRDPNRLAGSIHSAFLSSILLIFVLPQRRLPLLIFPVLTFAWQNIPFLSRVRLD